MKIIDAHNHPDWHGHDLDKFLANMDKNGIAQTWLLSWECAYHEYGKGYANVVPAELLGSSTGPIPFSRCISYKERAPERFVLGYSPDPRRPNACELLQAAHEIYGARVCGEFKVRMMMDDRDALWLFRTAGKLKMPVILHLQDDQRTSAPSSIRVSISTAVWMVMWMQPRIFAPFSGCSPAYLRRRPISAGISDSAMMISLRPQSASLISATL